MSNGGYTIQEFHLHFSPTAIALGSSAIVKVSGQNWSWPAKRFRGRFHQGFTKVAQVSLSLWSSGAGPFWGAKKFCGRFPHHFFTLVSQFLNSLLHFSSTALALGSSAIVKVLGRNDMFVFLGSLQRMAFASQKVLWSVPQSVLYIGLTVSCGFLGKWLLLQKRFCGGFRQLFFTFLSQMAVAS